MIYLFTGNMGAGKTPCRLYDFEQRRRIVQNEIGRRHGGRLILYFCHIDGLDKRKFNARELAEGQIMSARFVMSYRKARC